MIERDALIRLSKPAHAHDNGPQHDLSTHGQHVVSAKRLPGGRRDSTASAPGDDRARPSDGRAREGYSSLALPPRQLTLPTEPSNTFREQDEASHNAEDSSSRGSNQLKPSGSPSQGYKADSPSPPMQKRLNPSAQSFGNNLSPVEASPGSRRRRGSLAPSERSAKSSKVYYGHPGIIRLYSTFNDATSLYYVLQLAPNGELLFYIRKYGSFDLPSTQYYTALLLDAMHFMHERGVVHRDLKPENLLLDEDMRLKITDFGSAKVVSSGSPDLADRPRKRSFVGSADFVSPEVLRNEQVTGASDMWAFGCIIFYLMTGKPPFRAATDYITFQKILKHDFESPSDLDPNAHDLIDRLLASDSSDRPSCEEVKSHVFFDGIDWNTLWTTPAPDIKTGLVAPAPPPTHSASEDIWAVFDEEVSDGGFEFDDGPTSLAPPTSYIDSAGETRDHRHSPHFDRRAAFNAVLAMDENVLAEDLEPPRPSFVEETKRKVRGLSHGSARSGRSSSSSTSRRALGGLLESMRLSGTSARTSRSSVQSESVREEVVDPQWFAVVSKSPHNC